MRKWCIFPVELSLKLTIMPILCNFSKPSRPISYNLPNFFNKFNLCIWNMANIFLIQLIFWRKEGEFCLNLSRITEMYYIFCFVHPYSKILQWHCTSYICEYIKYAKIEQIKSWKGSTLRPFSVTISNIVSIRTAWDW